MPPYPVLLANAQAGHDTKFAALCAAAARCFSTASPFENMHLPGAYSSSYSQGSAGKITSSTHSHPLSTSASSSTGGVNRSTPNLSSNRYSLVSEAQPRRQGKKVAQNVAPQTQCSLFEDTSHPILPLLLPAFVGLNATIDDQHTGR
ncbi:hypothetical protein AAF712_007015 [Marasmius tenuissimus]|uniref:Uncharacterized protein n=1 Tax=Marasmius tenuissimus TaxID=585030 RepID=A0ABR2ZXT4_9AGAR